MFPRSLSKFLTSRPASMTLGLMKFRISIDSPALFITAVAKDRLPVFQSDVIRHLTCEALNRARTSCGFLLFAYVLMPDHTHLLTDSPRKPSEVLKYIKGNIAHDVISYLKERKLERSLAKLEHVDWKRNHRFSLWQHDSDIFSVFSESTFMQKVNYIHNNPVRAGLVERAGDYRWSSARYWSRIPTEDEPLRVDLDDIEWRTGSKTR